ncbi:MAG: hypothetical protein P4K78_10740 [Terracidiphilus sp.]|nr:hypothetical protein [Terracidiphilus sp.]
MKRAALLLLLMLPFSCFAHTYQRMTSRTIALKPFTRTTMKIHPVGHKRIMLKVIAQSPVTLAVVPDGLAELAITRADAVRLSKGCYVASVLDVEFECEQFNDGTLIVIDDRGKNESPDFNAITITTMSADD